MQKMPWDFDLAFERAGSSIPARMAMIAITTSNSIKVNPRELTAGVFGLVDIKYRFLIWADILNSSKQK